MVKIVGATRLYYKYWVADKADRAVLSDRVFALAGRINVTSPQLSAIAHDRKFKLAIAAALQNGHYLPDKGPIEISEFIGVSITETIKNWKSFIDVALPNTSMRGKGTAYYQSKQITVEIEGFHFQSGRGGGYRSVEIFYFEPKYKKSFKEEVTCNMDNVKATY